MSFFNRFFLLLSLFPGIVRGQLFADFQTTEGNFTVELDYTKAPLACSNFVLLSGKPDDIWETPPGALSLTSGLYRSTAESDVNRLDLNVAYAPPTEPDAPFSSGRYDIYQFNTYIGSVDAFETGGAYREVTGAGRFEIRRLSSKPNRYQIRFLYRRPWLDSRFSLIRRDLPMYTNIPITRVEPGKRFFSGSFTNDTFDNPGYQFQDENVRTPGNGNNPYGIPFNTGYILAMDSYGPNTNGSRFFITAVGDPSWNGNYTAIGYVQQNAGRQVIQNIVNTKVTDLNVPEKQMSITKISFRYVGLTVAFFETYHQNRLPGQIEEIPLGITRDGNGELSLVTPVSPQSQTVIHQSTDLVDFSANGLLSQSPLVKTPQLVDLSTAIVPKRFYLGYRTELPSWPSSEGIDFEGGRYVFKLNSANASGTLSLTFESVKDRPAAAIYQVDTVVRQNLVGGGTVTKRTKGFGSLALTYSSEPGPFKGKLTFSNIVGPLDIDEITLNFESTPVGMPVVRSFSALKSDTGPFFFSYTGHYQKAN